MKNILTLFFLLIFQIAIAGTLRGIVKDAKTSEPLIGATIVLKGTKLGSAAGLDGSFEIKNVPVGTYEIVVSYIGYETKTQKIEVNSNNQTLDFSLSETASQLETTVVTAQADRETDQNVRKSEQKADNVLNIIGARAIQLLPDITVGNVLQRVSGVSVVRNSNGDGQYAIIRGMDKRYNYTLVNGIKIPSSDNKNRYVPMDIFPAEMLERLEVVKALTPNMEGDAIGGAMNMIMKSAPDHLVVSATASTGYSTIFSDRAFSGFSTKGIAFQSPAQINGNTYIAQVSDFSIKTLQYKESQPINSLFGFTLGNRVLNNKLGFIVAGNYQKTYRGSNTLYYLANGQPSPDPEPNTPLFERIERRQNNSEQERMGVHVKLDYVFNKNNKLSLYNLFLQLDDKQHRHVENLNFGIGDQSINDRSRFTRQNIYNTTLQGDHQLTNKLKLNWSAVYSLATSKTPDWADMWVTYRIVRDVNGKITDSTRYIDPVSHAWLQNKDEDKTGYLNLTYNVFKDAEISAGGMYRNKERSNYYTDYSLNTVLPGSDRQVFTSIDKAQFVFRPFSNAVADTTNGNNYTAIENIAAGYIQGKILIKNKLQVLGGVRFESTAQSYASQLPVTVAGKTGSITYLDILPSAHVKYILDAKQNLRLSYFKSISRPGYFEFIPANLSGEYFNEGGNYNIKHTVADNIDMRYEYFPNGYDHFLGGVFYKNIVNPIEYGFAQVGNNSFLYTPQNFGTATNYGLELVFAKYIKSWGISGNYTYTHSTITTTKKVYYRDKNGAIKNAPPVTAEYPTAPTQTRPLQGQSDHIANLSLIYKNGKLGLDAQLSWVYTGARINIVSAYKDLDYWQRPTSQLDFSTEKRFKKHYSVFLKVTNLLDNPIIMEIHHANNYINLPNFPEQTQTNNILVQKDAFGRSFLVGIRYKLQ